jgi:hypothetical protein
MSQLTERFADAVRALVCDGAVKLRLTRAFTDHLKDLDETDFPPALRRQFIELQAALTRVDPVGSEDRVRATVQKMSAADASRYATSIVQLYAELLGQTERAEPLKVVTGAKAPPRFLASRP